ncbi:MAG: hypothetical protein NT069_01730 [Planctomycetota bacterium]|nr:hypothetical protein [Planctomycetota bacterium]
MADFIQNRLKGYSDRSGQPFGDDHAKRQSESKRELPSDFGRNGGDGDSDDGGEGGDSKGPDDGPQSKETKEWDAAPTGEFPYAKIPSVEARCDGILAFVDLDAPPAARPSDWSTLSGEIRRVVKSIQDWYRAHKSITVFQDSTLATIEIQIQEIRELGG